MVQADKKLVHPDLHKIHLDFPNPKDWYPRGGLPAQLLSPGLNEITHNHGVKRGYDRLGLSEKDFAIIPTCRWCGSKMFIVEETDNAIVWGCAFENCKNNPDNPYSKYVEERARRRIGTIREDQFGEDYVEL